VLQGDAREVLRGVVPVGAVVITDPPWPVFSDGLYNGASWQPGLLRDVLEVCAPARRVVIISSALTDPRWLAEVADRWPFVSTGWMRYTVPRYRGTRLAPGLIAHVFGDRAATRGRRVIACETTCPGGLRYRVETAHPTPLDAHAARWAVGMYTNEGDTVVDPFCGSGVILEAARGAGCDVIGCDMSAVYADEARARVSAPMLLDGAW
jgi:hypothetical protein